MAHLIERFAGSLCPSEPPAEDREWFEALLSQHESAELAAMSVPDREHAVGCGRRAQRLLGDAATRELVVASGLHDVGKTAANLGTFGRVAATAIGRIVPATRRASWVSRGGWRRRVQLYLEHDVRGAEALCGLGSARAVVTWAREHHLDEGEWTLPVKAARCLAEADLVSSPKF
jgi:predicted HD phosphohydrolase